MPHIPTNQSDAPRAELSDADALERVELFATGRNLRARRLMLQLSIPETARRIGLSREGYKRLEAGLKRLNSTEWRRIEEAFVLCRNQLDGAVRPDESQFLHIDTVRGRIRYGTGPIAIATDWPIASLKRDGGTAHEVTNFLHEVAAARAIRFLTPLGDGRLEGEELQLRSSEMELVDRVTGYRLCLVFEDEAWICADKARAGLEPVFLVVSAIHNPEPYRAIADEVRRDTSDS